MKQQWYKQFLVGSALLMLLCSASAHAGPIRVAFHDTTVVGTMPADIPLYLDSSVTGLGVISYQTVISFNNTVFTFDHVSTAGTLTAGWSNIDTSISVSGSTTKITIAGSGAGPLSGIGPLVVLTFIPHKYSYNTYGYLTIDNILLNEGSPSTTTKNGTIYITAPPTITVYPDNALLTKGDTKQFTVSGGTAPYVWSLTNPSVGTIDGSGLVTTSAAGLTKVVCVDSNGTVDTTGVVDVRALQISVHDTSRYQGQWLNLPILTTSVTGLSIMSGQFTISYDPRYWTPDSIITAGSMLAGWFMSPLAPKIISSSQATVTVAFSSSSPMTGTGVLFFLRMQASTVYYGTPYFSFSNPLFNESIVPNAKSGYIGVVQLSPLSVSPGGSQSVIVGDSIHFTASGGVVPYQWSVSDTSKAFISPAGWLHPKKGGTVTAIVHDSIGASGTSGTISIYDFTLSIRDTAILPHDTIEVPLYVTPNHAGFTAVQMKVTFTNNANIQLEDVVSGGTLLAGWSLDKLASTGSVMIAASGVNPVSAGGMLLRLRFSVANTVSLPSTINVSFSDVVFNQGVPLPFIDNGYFTVSNHPVFGIAPSSASIHTPTIGTKDSAQFTIRNNGTTTLTSSISRNGSSEFTLSTSSISVPPNDSVIVTVFYLPVNAGDDTATVLFSTNDPNRPSPSVMVTGSVVSFPILQVSPTSISFGSVKIGQSKTGMVTISNTGTATLNVTSIVSNNAVFTSKINTISISAGASTVDTLRFTPTSVTSYSARFLVSSNASVIPDTIKVTGIGTASLSVPEVGSVPKVFSLSQNYPNPFNPTTSIEFTLEHDGMTTLKVYNMLGQEVATLVNEDLKAGEYHHATFNASRLASGIYFMRLQSGSQVQLKKLSLIK